jgi:hypothetical protein
MSIQKKSLISTLKTAKKANVAASAAHEDPKGEKIASMRLMSNKSFNAKGTLSSKGFNAKSIGTAKVSLKGLKSASLKSAKSQNLRSTKANFSKAIQ